MAKGKQVTVYLDKNELDRLDQLVSAKAEQDKKAGLEGYEITSRSKLLSKIVNEYLDSHPRAILSIEEIRMVAEELSRAYGVDKMYLFGSYARGEADIDSDVDLLIDKGKVRGLEIVDLQLDLAERLDRKVDVVTIDSAPPHIKAAAEQESVLLYAAS